MVFLEWNVNYLIPGLRLASNVYFPNAKSELLFEEGCILTKEMISKLKRRKIAIVSVEIDETINHYDDELFCQTCELFRTCDISNILKMIRKYVDIATNSDNLIFDIRKYFTGENDFFSHMTNMLVMSIALAKWHNQSSSKNQRIPLDKVAQLAAFKDIGWIAKSDNIRGLLKDKYALIIESLRKRFPEIPLSILDDYIEEYRHVYSYLIYREFISDSQVEEAILYSKMPNSSEDEQIRAMCNVVKLVDVYDALLIHNIKEEPENPLASIQRKLESLISQGILDAYWTKLLKVALPLFPRLSKVLLSDNTIALVSEINIEDMLKPKLIDLQGREILLNKENATIIRPYLSSLGVDAVNNHHKSI